MSLLKKGNIHLVFFIKKVLRLLVIKSNSPEETLKIGCRTGKVLTGGAVLTLKGALGAGKTTFVKGIATALDIKEEITSPSFTLISEYQGRVPLFHVDLYRIREKNELYDIGLEELLYGQEITVIEWPEAVKDWLPLNTINIIINIVGHYKREIIVNGITI